MPRLGDPKYFQQLVADPVAVVVFLDKIIIVREGGTILSFDRAREDEFDDMPEGHG